jgi:hypothetical protein
MGGNMNKAKNGLKTSAYTDANIKSKTLEKTSQYIIMQG